MYWSVMIYAGWGGWTLPLVGSFSLAMGCVRLAIVMAHKVLHFTQHPQSIQEIGEEQARTRRVASDAPHHIEWCKSGELCYLHHQLQVKAEVTDKQTVRVLVEV